jgi:uncharacterized membrane protein
MNLKDPESMNIVIGKVLRYGVIVSALMILLGALGLAAASGGSETSGLLTYDSGTIPHGTWYQVSLSGLASGLVSLTPSAWIELGVILLIVTPVSRVLISVLLFAAERDRLYVLITAVVLALLLFSILVTPLIPGFHA